ncbi:FMN-dependent NADPH-azoreductase [Variibacter gotjawalensis]|uniref:FMN-dependent NADPH-azoreductase n=1 Tax=Variibacter gotjawalensis TaxID=1333996 RepID=A0A0S3PRP8_9BRAD|nr:NADPH-dependent FMN reductase [Variibacter gotjawalensis]NIK48800.1 chromate reductase [Variibacter gotjawalensis]RZS50661.1 chromate reductase [Variibacter gotjawalensis]BAT58494.1 FMN-dependent NADPH-azoreductase [Variibacter gotjawalensis]
MTNVITICGSVRKGSFNRMLANALPALAPDGMKITDAPSWEKFPVYNADIQNGTGFPSDVEALAAAIRKADGVIIVTPEYNYSVPGGLKNALDWVSRLKDQPFVNKPVAIQSASGGPLGGARVQYHLRQILVFLDALTFNKPEVFVGAAQTKLDAEKGLHDETTRDFIKQQLAAFDKFIARVKA